jgi:translation initiation factor 2B subunit (eIF-2B alpha/beta/delta family)
MKESTMSESNRTAEEILQSKGVRIEGAMLTRIIEAMDDYAQQSLASEHAHLKETITGLKEHIVKLNDERIALEISRDHDLHLKDEQIDACRANERFWEVCHKDLRKKHNELLRSINERYGELLNQNKSKQNHIESLLKELEFALMNVDQFAMDFAYYLENESENYDKREQKTHAISEHLEHFKQSMLTKQ